VVRQKQSLGSPERGRIPGRSQSEIARRGGDPSFRFWFSDFLGRKTVSTNLRNLRQLPTGMGMSLQALLEASWVIEEGAARYEAMATAMQARLGHRTRRLARRPGLVPKRLVQRGVAFADRVEG
jgi:hypothetical protein